MQFNNPLQMISARSPDGTWIVISQSSHSPARFQSSVIWYELKDPQLTESAISEPLSTHLVFSPGNKNIAAVVINQNTAKRILYHFSPKSGDSELLPDIKDVWSLAWIPDGMRLVQIQDVYSIEIENLCL